MSNLTIKRTHAGYGLFTTSIIFAGEVIDSFCHGEVLPVSSINAQDWRDKYCLQVTKDCYLAPASKLKDTLPVGDVTDFDYGWYTNHSCEPNSKIIFPTANNSLGYDPHRPFLVATRNIMPDEEITFDYATTQTHAWQMICACGSRNCRDVIGPARTLPLSTVCKYVLRGLMPGYAIKSALLDRW